MLRFLILIATCLNIIHSNNAPLVGILTVPLNDSPLEHVQHYKSYVPLPYVSWLEGGGARVIPILCNDTMENVQNMLSKLNGLLIFSDDNAFCWKQLNNIITYLRQYNQNNNNIKSIPLWSIGIAFQSILIHTAKTTNIFTKRLQINDDTNINSNSKYTALSLYFTSFADDSSVFDSKFMNLGYSAMVYNKLWMKKLSVFNINEYEYISYVNTFIDNNYLMEYFDIVAMTKINQDNHNYPFVSLIESKKYLNLSWYGSQFNPTIPQYYQVCNDMDNKENNDDIYDDYNRVLVSQYFAEYFVNECRIKNDNKMNIDEYNDNVMYNYNTKLIKRDVDNSDNTYEQIFFF